MRLRSNVNTIYAFKFLSEFLLLVPAILPLYRARNLTVTHFLAAQAAYSAATLALEIPSGYLADALSDALEKRLGAKWTIGLLLLTGPAFLVLGTTASPWLVPLILLNAALWGASTPFVLNRLNRLIESEIRATVLLVSGMVSRVVLVVCSPLFGAAVDHASVHTAYLALGAARGER